MKNLVAFGDLATAYFDPWCPSKLQHLAMRLMFYLHIQQWMNRELDPINFGWELSEEKYRPIQDHEQLCPR